MKERRGREGMKEKRCYSVCGAKGIKRGTPESEEESEEMEEEESWKSEEKERKVVCKKGRHQSNRISY